jgi:hypothetical protein
MTLKTSHILILTMTILLIIWILKLIPQYQLYQDQYRHKKHSEMEVLIIRDYKVPSKEVEM